MDRRESILEYVTKDQRGIEIGPYFNPLASKATGWNVLSLDVFDATTLRGRAANDPNVPATMVPNIEEVDILGPAHRLAELVSRRGELGRFDFVISSHNFEHLPNPIGFLRACAEVLRPRGVLSMAIPDKRACFDYFRPISTLGGLLQADSEDRQRPTAAQLFDQQSLQSRYHTTVGDLTGFPLIDDPSQVIGLHTVEDAYQSWRVRIGTASENVPYEDCHCWTFTPNSLRLLMLDLRFLRLTELVPIKICDTQGSEFYAHFENMRTMPIKPMSRAEYYEERQVLLHAVNADSSVNALHPASSIAGALTHAHGHAKSSSTNGKFEHRYDEMRRATEQISHLTDETSRLQSRLDAMLASSSWRLTAPMRAVMLRLRQRKLQGRGMPS